MGLGSGGLFVVYLTVFAGYGQLAAQGLNLLFFILSTGAALFVHIKKQHLPIKRLIFVCGMGCVGCIAGAILAQRLSSDLLRNIFAILLIASGVISLLQKNTVTEKP